MLETYEQNSKKKLAATVLAVIVISGAVIIADHLKAKTIASTISASQKATPTTSVTSAAGNQTTVPSTSASIAATTGYKDGIYTAIGNYYVPHGDENITVNVTLSKDVVTAVSIRNSEFDNVSASYQEDFASVYKSYVVGKKISSLRLGLVAGASDTTQGFNDALKQITAKAKA